MKNKFVLFTDVLQDQESKLFTSSISPIKTVKFKFLKTHISKLNQGFHILTDHLFGRGKTFYSNLYKTIEYYQTILQESGSICFTHHSNSSEGTIDYSKAQILKVISPQDWSINPYSEKILVGYLLTQNIPIMIIKRPGLKNSLHAIIHILGLSFLI
uniref:Uncharacterized protein n=1 Tax=Lactuca sativa TaxID=4236 RepID=A0A9R1UMQ0_LACSA|nr:hypothetical protein LSAT_V11C800397260 [Lactuca sativa]